MELRAPQTQEEWGAMFHLRWDILRQPWGQAPGSERDELEDSAWHRIVLTTDQEIVGTGRLHQTDHKTAQIRYMAVKENYRGMGIGKQILLSLEDQARTFGFKTIRLDAREAALPFYRNHGYETIRKSHVLFNVIQHIEMKKVL
jgi:predicted GNAT family N-acyltransferase